MHLNSSQGKVWNFRGAQFKQPNQRAKAIHKLFKWNRNSLESYVRITTIVLSGFHKRLLKSETELDVRKQARFIQTITSAMSVLYVLKQHNKGVLPTPSISRLKHLVSVVSKISNANHKINLAIQKSSASRKRTQRRCRDCHKRKVLPPQKKRENLVVHMFQVSAPHVLKFMDQYKVIHNVSVVCRAWKCAAASFFLQPKIELSWKQSGVHMFNFLFGHKSTEEDIINKEKALGFNLRSDLLELFNRCPDMNCMLLTSI